MTHKGKILLVFPHNFFELRSGIHRRFYEICKYLNDRGFIVDQLGLENFESKWNDYQALTQEKLINQLYLYDFRKGISPQKFLINRILNVFKNSANVEMPGRLKTLPDFAFKSMQRFFNDILKKNNYQYILISYVYWAKLIDRKDLRKTNTILTLEDFISLTLFDAHYGDVNIGNLIGEEIHRINMFDKVIGVSPEEINFFSRFTKKPEYFYVPFFLDKVKPGEGNSIKYDVLFVGFDNYSNINGMNWFFRDVYPLLSKSLNILIVGKITEQIGSYPNVTKIPYIEKISDAYCQSRVSINPLIDGTGVKVKLIESLAHGIPVVSTSRGLTGIPPEIFGDFIQADEPDAFANAIHELLADQQYYRRQCETARRIFKNTFDKSVVLNRLDKIFK